MEDSRIINALPEHPNEKQQKKKVITVVNVSKVRKYRFAHNGTYIAWPQFKFKTRINAYITVMESFKFIEDESYSRI